MTDLLHTSNGSGRSDKKYDYSDDDDDISSSDSESDNEGPPQKISIERSTDLETLKNAFLKPMDKPVSRDNLEIESIRLGKNALTDIASTFEKGGQSDETANGGGKAVDREAIVVDKELYSSYKNKFENPIEDSAQQKGDRKIEIERSEANKNRVKKTFFQNENGKDTADNIGSIVTADVGERQCCVCQKIVYPMERMQISSNSNKIIVFHRTCFKCSACQKSLTIENYATYQNRLYCKFHALEKIHPELALTPEMAERMEVSNELDEDEEYALVTRPKVLDPNVVKGGAKLNDNLEFMPHLSDKKKEWAESVEQSATGKIDRRTAEIDSNMFQSGKVKSRMSKFIEGENGQHQENDVEENDDYKNANVTRSATKKKDEIKVDIDAKSIKNKFETGLVDSPSSPTSNEHISEELSALKGTLPVKERYKEQQQDQQPLSPDSEGRRKSILEDLPPVATMSIHEAKEKFMKGETAFHDTSNTPDRTHDIVTFTELSSVKDRFEGAKTDDQCRSLPTSEPKVPAHARCAELGTLKASFEAGGKKKYTEEELEARRKEHLEREFKRLQKEKTLFAEKARREAEEEAKCLKTVPYEEEVRQCAELGSIKQRFEEGTAFASHKMADRQLNSEEEEALKALEAKRIKAKFEGNAFSENKGGVLNEERRKNIQAEFEQFKELNENQRQLAEAEAQNQPLTPDPGSDLALAAEHTQKMKAKWDKIQRKEAKKAQKSANAKKHAQTFINFSQTSPAAEFCNACNKRVYLAERVECDVFLYHRACFKCKHCGCTLRLETCGNGPDGVYCPSHYKALYNNMSQPVMPTMVTKSAEHSPVTCNGQQNGGGPIITKGEDEMAAYIHQTSNGFHDSYNEDSSTSESPVPTHFA